MNAFNAAGLSNAPLPSLLSSSSSSSSSAASFKGSSVTSLFLAAIIPFVLLKLLAFFTHTWPNLVYRFLTSRLERQIATVEERVFPNRLIQDDIMIRSIMGYVSYSYLQTLRSGTNACDAVSMADYSYTFLYENSENFNDDWVPYSSIYKSVLGRVIVAAMELSVLPSTGQAIQVEPGLFVRSLTNKHVAGDPPGGRGKEEEEESGESEGNGSCAAQKGARGSGAQNQMDRLNRYAFYDMRKFAENMDEHAQPAIDGNIDDLDSAERPFDPPAQQRRDKKKNKQGDGKESSNCFDNEENPKEENIIVLEYRHPLPYETAQALCTGANTAGVAMEYDAERPAGDVIEGFLRRAHTWYLSHVGQRKTMPLMALYPAPLLSHFTAVGAYATKPRREGAGDFSGRCYVLEGVAPAASAAAGTQAAAAAAASVAFTAEAAPAASQGIQAAVSIGPSSTVSGGLVGLGGTAAAAVASKGKTFASLFFPAKARVLSLVDDFVHEKGSYGVPGVVPRLSFFLHGAPGTGKTSFVKALARHMRRNLVMVSMGEVVTVEELRRLLQPFELNHSGNSNGDRYGDNSENNFSVRPHQSIYVFEDFDAIGDAWQALKRDQVAREVAAKVEAADKNKKKKEEEEEDSAGDDEDGSDNHSSSGRKKDSAAESEKTGKRTRGSGVDSDADGASGGDDGDASSGEKGSTAPAEDDGSAEEDDDGDSDGGSGSSSSYNDSATKFVIHEGMMEELERTQLTVERFLEVFNGFNLPDSFIAVFTTNHPQRVHPLITSSNMMDVVLDMGMLDDACAMEMVTHYFVHELVDEEGEEEEAAHKGPHRRSRGGGGNHHHPRLSKAQEAELRAALHTFNSASGGLSGAVLEKMCIECDTIQQLIQRLRHADTWELMNAF